MYVYGLLLLGLVASTHGFCMFGKPITEMSKYGTISQFCMYKGLKMQVGSHIKTADCMECNCGANGLHCCGFGIKAGVVQPPDGCKVVGDGCKMLVVKSDDETKDCFSGNSLVKQ
ncbi:uncharacterized protein [Haliotis cracherodii]|uniref:uncharacterized protein n=1 Tax=Haliotis cracherodii TaxID=6455 RepID=UPI0039E7D8E0